MTSQAPKEERARERQETETERGPWRAAKTRAAERRARPGAPAPDPAQVQPPGRRPPRPPREAPEPAGTEPGGRVPAPSAPGLRLSSGAWQSLACHLPTSPGRLGDGRGRRSAGGSGRRPSEGPGARGGRLRPEREGRADANPSGPLPRLRPGGVRACDSHAPAVPPPSPDTYLRTPAQSAVGPLGLLIRGPGLLPGESYAGRSAPQPPAPSRLPAAASPVRLGAAGVGVPRAHLRGHLRPED